MSIVIISNVRNLSKKDLFIDVQSSIQGNDILEAKLGGHVMNADVYSQIAPIFQPSFDIFR